MKYCWIYLEYMGKVQFVFIQLVNTEDLDIFEYLRSIEKFFFKVTCSSLRVNLTLQLHILNLIYK